MNILIVDDQQDVVKGVVSAINWTELGIDQFHTANSMGEAQLVFRDNEVDILVTDIEMPLGSGIDLVTWVREEYPATECIFLTSHEDFSYARAALKLGSFDYLLQPIKYDELKRVIINAISKFQSRSHYDEYYAYGKYWEENAEQLRERFWFQVLSSTYQQNKARLDVIASQLKLSRTDEYLPVLVNILRRQVQLSEWDDDLLKHTITNVLEELIYDRSDVLQIVQMDSSHYVVLLPLTPEGQLARESLYKKLSYFVDFYELHLKSSMSCYAGVYVQPERLPDEYQRLLDLEKNNVARYKGVFPAENGAETAQQKLNLPEINCWQKMIEAGESSRTFESVQSYIGKMIEAGVVNTQFLNNFQNEFMEMIWAIAKERGVKIQEIISEKAMVDLYLNSLHSIEDFFDFIRLAVTIPERPTMNEQDYLSAVEQVKTYIRDNLDREMSRNEIAEKVYLNPEYLSRMFRKHTGVTLSDFITNERVRTAKEYLANTKMPVSIIASKTGYSNFSHFSKIFKKLTGLTPNEYRQSKQSGS